MSDVLKCIAIDDEPLALRIIKQYAQTNPSLQLLHVFDDAVSAAEYLRNTEVDLIFTDINMPDISGLDLVRSLENKPMIIFTTAYKKFAFEGFELEATDYLLKPFDKDRFAKAVQKALDQKKLRKNARQNESDFISVRSEYRLVKIDADNIESIEGLEDYIKFNLSEGKPVLTLMTMKAIMEKLSAEKFIRIHRSYIVNFSRIKSLVNKHVTLTSGNMLPVSDTYSDALKGRLQSN
jgi:two-component system LytT family response regulator